MAQLFVGQLPFNKFYPADLLDLFEPFGKVVAQEIHIRKGNGFVTFPTTAEADAAILALHGKYVVPGRHQPLQVIYSKGTKMISQFGRSHRNECLALREGSRRGSRSDAASQKRLSAANTTVTSMDEAGALAAASAPFSFLQSALDPLSFSSTAIGPMTSTTNIVSPMMNPPHGSMPQAMYPPVTSLNGSQPAMYVMLAPPSQGGVPSSSMFDGSFGSNSNSNASGPPPVNMPNAMPASVPSNPEAAQYMYHPLGFLFQQ